MMREAFEPVDDGAAAAPGAVARIIEFAPGRRAALPPHTTLEIVEDPRPVPVPGASRHAYGLLTWQQRRIPMIDLDALLDGGSSAGPPAAPRFALVVAWQDAPGEPVQQGAIALQQLPQTVEVHDAQQCDLPRDSDGWPYLATACFSHAGQAVPIVDTARLFNAGAAAAITPAPSAPAAPR